GSRPAPDLMLVLGGDGRAGRAGDAGAAEPAITERVLRQILLVIILGEVEGRGVPYLGGDLAVTGRAQLLLKAVARGFRGAALLRRVGVDRRAVLRADIVALPHALARVVAFPEQFEEGLVARHFRVVDDEHGLGMAGPPAAHLFIGRVGRMPAGIADRRRPDARRLPEDAPGAPDAAEPDLPQLH